jgi:hypothetical protein
MPAREMQGGIRDDIGAALAVLGRRSVLTDGASSQLERVDLRNAELHGLAIPNVCFAHPTWGARNCSARLIADRATVWPEGFTPPGA